MKKVLLGITILLCITGVATTFIMLKDSPKVGDNKAEATETAEDSEGQTTNTESSEFIDKISKMQAGMDKKEVRKILGQEHAEKNENKIDK